METVEVYTVRAAVFAPWADGHRAVFPSPHRAYDKVRIVSNHSRLAAQCQSSNASVVLCWWEFVEYLEVESLKKINYMYMYIQMFVIDDY